MSRIGAGSQAAFGQVAGVWTDLLRGLDAILGGRVAPLVRTGVALLMSWWIYVPVHELLHAAACAAAGGRVERLEIDSLYGGALLAKVVPFVVAGGEYAGRLSGFDTHGSDLVYLATDFGPFLLTLFPGVWLLRRGARAGNAWMFGAAMPLAFAPWMSLTGDAYEIGSLVAVHLLPWRSQTGARALLVGDDFVARARELAAAGANAPWGGLVVGALVGVLWATATTALASVIASRLGQPRLQPVARVQGGSETIGSVPPNRGIG